MVKRKKGMGGEGWGSGQVKNELGKEGRRQVGSKMQLHPYGVYYALQYKSEKNAVFLVSEFGEGKKNQRKGEWGKNKKLYLHAIHTPLVNFF